MSVQTNSYQLLINKLDRFIRKYYINKLIRGTLISTAIIVLMFNVITSLEYFYYFPSSVRKLMFYSFLGISGISLILGVCLPLLNYFKLGKVISHERAAGIIGEHFTNVKDKLLNILQLKKQAGSGNSGLVLASIDQKIGELKPVPFRSAINLAQNKKHLKYALPPLMVLGVLVFAAPSLITNGTTRLINNNTEYERPAPFTFELLTEEMTVVQFEDYDIDIKVRANEGGALPNEAFIDVDNYRYKLVKDENDKTRFTYRFKKVSKDTKFKFNSGGFESKDYDLSVLKKPNLVGFDLRLIYPSYIGRKNETVSNIGDIVVPVGTSIKWSFTSQNTENVEMKFSSKKQIQQTNRTGDNTFSLKKGAYRDENYMIYVSNQYLKNADSVGYSIAVTPDLYPTINVEQIADSTEKRLLFFIGDASDDYGLQQLTFNYKIEKEDRSPSILQSKPLSFAAGRQTNYDLTWDLLDLNLKPGDKLTYYFQVGDNDAINGSKTAKTGIMTYAIPTVEEFDDMEEEKNEEIKDDLKDAIVESKEIKKDLKDLKEKLLQKKELDWQDKKEIENLMEKHKELKEKLDNAKQNFEENMENQSEFEETKESILEKQEMIQELMDELMTDEMKEMMEKLEELLDEMTRDEALEELDEMEMSDEELEKELDRMLELFKEMELEHEMEQAIDKLEELAEEEEKLSEESKDSRNNQEELKDKQEELNEKFEKLQEDLEEIKKKNEELENPKDLGDNDEESEDIKEEMEKSSEQLEQKQNSKASESQKSASEKMKEMAEKMAGAMAGAQMDQMEEDMESLRQLLENLVDLSFDQEEVMVDIQKTNINTPKYVELVQNQYKLKDDFKMIEDSLQELSKRVFQIESFVTEKVTDVKKSMKKGLVELEERKKNTANVQQQYTMTGANDLALMLSEVMEQMQQSMAQQMSGDQMCQNPGQGKPGKGKGKGMKLGDMQKQLNDQISKMEEEMKGGKKPGGKKGGKGGSSKKFAEMAKKQSEIRNALQKMQEEKSGKGEGASQELQEMINEMNKTETDLVNKRLSNEMLKRQQDILTKLLKSENAEREREFDNKRKSETAIERERKMPPELEEYIKKRESEIEMYKAVSPSLKPYYKSLVEDYFKSLKN